MSAWPISDGERVLHEMLRGRGVDTRAPGSVRVFYLDFLRQFDVTDEDGEHDHFEQLHCEFRFPITAETRSFERFNHWWFAGEGSEAWSNFIELVEQRPEFVAMTSTTPQAVSIQQEPV